jgi:hypothetical protein
VKRTSWTWTSALAYRAQKKQSCGGGVDLCLKPSLGAVAQALLYGRLLDMPGEEVMAAMRRPVILSTIIRHDQARL